MSNEKQSIQAINQFDKHAFLANHFTASHEPEKFILDFKNIHPEFTPDNQAMLNIIHRVIIMDPYFAKTVLNVLDENIKKFEQKYGKIKKPESVEKAEKQPLSPKEKATSTKPNYLG